MIRERVIRIHIDDKALSFSSEEQIRVFQNAIGKMVSYGMRADDNEGLEHVELFVSETKEITGAFYPPVNWQPTGGLEAQAPFMVLSAAIDAFKQDMPYVIGAVLQANGEYSFIS